MTRKFGIEVEFYRKRNRGEKDDNNIRRFTDEYNSIVGDEFIFDVDYSLDNSGIEAKFNGGVIREQVAPKLDILRNILKSVTKPHGIGGNGHIYTGNVKCSTKAATGLHVHISTPPNFLVTDILRLVVLCSDNHAELQRLGLRKYEYYAGDPIRHIKDERCLIDFDSTCDDYSVYLADNKDYGIRVSDFGTIEFRHCHSSVVNDQSILDTYIDKAVELMDIAFTGDPVFEYNGIEYTDCSGPRACSSFRKIELRRGTDFTSATVRV